MACMGRDDFVMAGWLRRNWLRMCRYDKLKICLKDSQYRFTESPIPF